MTVTKHLSFMRLGLVALIAAAITGCGGGGDGGGGVAPPPPSSGTLSVNLAAGATSGSPNNAFSALSGAPLVTSHSPTQVNFTVIGSDGQPVKNLTLYSATGAGGTCGAYNIRVAMAKLNKGSGGTPDAWQNLISQVRSSGNPGNFVEGTTDPVPTATVPASTVGVGSLTYNSAGYYTYTLGTTLTDPAYVAGSAVSTNKIFTNGNTLAKDGTTTYRVGLQICYVDGLDANGKTKTVNVNPIFDFTMGSNGDSVAVTDPTKTRKVVDRTSCNQCHGSLAMHGGRRVDPNYCVMCHNIGSVDYHDNDLTTLINYETGGDYGAGGAPIDLKYMVHKFHFGERLTKAYQVADAVANEVTFPQDQTNCTKCHDNSKSHDADNWKNMPSRNACGACHDGINFKDGTGEQMDQSPGNLLAHLGHIGGAQADDTNCHLCHNADAIANVYHIPVTAIVTGTNVTSYYVSTANTSRMPAGAVTVDYDIKSVSLDASRHPVMVFRILQSGVRTDLNVATGPTDTALWPHFFGAPTVYFAFSVPQDGELTPADFNAYYNASLLGIWNGSATGTSAGTLSAPDSNGYYTVTLTGRTIPANASLLTGAMGYAAMYQTDVAGYLRDCPATGAANCSNGLNVPAQDDSMAATGFTARRITVEAARCKLCHENLGIFAETTFHSGQRNDPKMCAMCHNPNRSSSGWSADSTSFVHGIHSASLRKQQGGNPFNWHAGTAIDPGTGLPVITGSFSGITVTFPQQVKTCTACHAPGGYNFDTTSGLVQVASRLYRTAAQGTMAAAGTAGALLLPNANVAGPPPILHPYLTSGSASTPAMGPGAAYGAGYNSSDASVACPTCATNLVNSPIANACFGCHEGDMVSQPGSSVQSHIELIGGGSIYRERGVAGTGDITKALGRGEQCLICHSTDGIAPIKVVHDVQ
jgi:OmcA/MtrC family decaheme c-type cytochrome